MTESTGFTDDQLAAARDQAAQNMTPPVAASLPSDVAVQVAAGGSATEVDVQALIAQMKRMQDQVDALQAERASRNAPALVSTAESLRDQLAIHATGISGSTADHAKVLSLADDAVDAAQNAVDSGDMGPLRALAYRISSALTQVDPGPGDHHYFRQAVGFVTHLHNAMDDFTADQAPAPAPSGKVLQGSVTG